MLVQRSVNSVLISPSLHWQHLYIVVFGGGSCGVGEVSRDDAGVTSLLPFDLCFQHQNNAHSDRQLAVLTL